MPERLISWVKHSPQPRLIGPPQGAPGKDYWQQQADYDIKASPQRDTAFNRRYSKDPAIRITPQTPCAIYGCKLDQNRFRDDSLDRRSRTSGKDRVSYQTLRDHQSMIDNDYGYQALQFSDASGNPIKATVVDTLVRLDLQRPLEPGAKRYPRSHLAVLYY